MLRNKIVARSIGLIICATLCLQAFPQSAGAWGAVTHYHINRSAGSLGHARTYFFAGTAPDMLITSVSPTTEEGSDYEWSDILHSPNPKKIELIHGPERPYADAPNFAYLMTRIAHGDDISDKDLAQSYGWGGHIVSDWVAHNDFLFPICSNTLGTILHAKGEALYDLYMTETRGPIAPWSVFEPFRLEARMNPSLIQKSIVNYRLISEHEESLAAGLEISDAELKDRALTTSLSTDYLEKRTLKWALTVTAMQLGYLATLTSMCPVSRGLLKSQMVERGAEENILLSIAAVQSWNDSPIARGDIPDYDSQVVPFYPFPLQAGTFPDPFHGNSYGGHRFTTSSWQTPFAWATGGVTICEDDVSTFAELIEDKCDPSEAFWEAVAQAAVEVGALKIDETSFEGDYSFAIELVDQALFEHAYEGVIIESLKDPVPECARQFAAFWRNLHFSEITDIDLLADAEPPIIKGVNPADGSFINSERPVISAIVVDNEGGIGVDADTIRLELDGHPLPFVYDAETGLLEAYINQDLPDGAYEAFISVRDLAGNYAQRRWNFTVDTVPPVLEYQVINRHVNAKKGCYVKVEVISDKPVQYVVEVFVVNPAGRALVDRRVYRNHFPFAGSVTWDGKDDAGKRVANGAYDLIVTAQDFAGNTDSFSIKVPVNNVIKKF